MKFLITGIAGGIGSTLGHQLYTQGHSIVGIDNFQNGYLDNLVINNQYYCDFYRADIKDTHQLIEIFKKTKPDVIIHLAATTALPVCENDPTAAIMNNVGGTNSLLEAARMSDIGTVIFASTSAIYENTDPILAPFKESAPINPRLIYPLSKKLGEELCVSFEQNYGMTVPRLRFFNVFGPRQDVHRTSPPLINYLVREFANNRAPVLHSTGLQVRDYIHVNDVTSLINLVAENPRKDSTINVSSGKLMSVRAIVDNVRLALDSSIEPVYQDSEKYWDSYTNLFAGAYKLDKSVIAKEVNKFALGDNSQAKEEYNWNPNTDLESLIQQTAQQIKDTL